MSEQWEQDNDVSPWQRDGWGCALGVLLALIALLVVVGLVVLAVALL